MLLKEINPFIRQILFGAVDIDNTKNDVFTPLKSIDCRLFYITSGTGEMIIEGKEYPLHEGCAILFRSDTPYIWNTKKANFIVVNFDYTNHFSHITKTFHPIKAELYDAASTIEHISFTDATELNRPLYLSDAHLIEYFLRRMSSDYYLENKYTAELLSSYMKSVIIMLLTNYSAESVSINSKEEQIVQRILLYIQDHYASDIGNERIASLYHFNSSYINKIFKKSTGTTIHRFLIDYRINVAKELLRTQNDSVKNIALKVGYTDIPHFVKSFQAHTGQTPSEYRNSAK